ncbi:EPIDERMAL PATTERNING FACTOR-like protein 2 [Platanthera zijinensis]|uniref:Epidermal patterning factor-like protein n=1 Tax=Platanthera zijinensis TaxID=2320716 RepID=A0AAP0C1Z5_9ASPA
MRMVSSIIGSRPPRCEGICGACNRCEPVPVPAIQETKSAVLTYMNTNNGGRGESSNYKPMNWKCKCGNFIFNP